MNTAPPPSERPTEYVSWSRDAWMFAEGVGLLMYHKIAPAPLATGLPVLYVTAGDFDRQMGELASAGLQGIPYDGLAAAVAAGLRGFCVSFDDGFCNVFQDALPILRRRKLQAIQFIVAGQIGGEDAWDRAINEPPLPLMDDVQIREWLAAGQAIGCHTLTHPHLPDLTLARARTEIFDSKKVLEDRFGIPIRHFCYPYGDYNEAVRDLVGEAGYETAPTVKFGANRPGVPPLELRRIMACNSLTPFRSAARRIYHLARRQP